MPQFLTPEHENELAGWLNEAHSQGATEQDLATIRDSYLQDKAITDRNYGEMRKPTDAPVMKGGIARGLFGALRRAGEPIAAMLSPERLKARAGNAAQDLAEGGVLNMVMRGAARDVSDVGRGMMDQAGRYQGQVKERREKGDELGADVALAQQALSLVPGVSQAVPLGEDFSRTGDAANLGAAATDIAMTVAPKALPPMGRAIKAGGNRAMASLFSPSNAEEMALVDRMAPQLADDGFKAITTRGAERGLLRREIEAMNAAREAESRLAPRSQGNTFGTRRAVDTVKERLRDTAGQIPGGAKGSKVAGDPMLAEALENEIAGMEALSRSGGRQAAEMLDYRRGLGSAASRGKATSPDVRAQNMTREAITQELGRSSPELASALGAADDASALTRVPLAWEPSPGINVGSTAATISALQRLLAMPAARTMSAVAMNRIGQLLQRGDVGAALALAQAATQQESQ